MAELNKLTLLKANLNMLNPPAERVAMLEQILEAAASRIAQRGITLEDTRGMCSSRWSMPHGCISAGHSRLGRSCRNFSGWTSMTGWHTRK